MLLIYKHEPEGEARGRVLIISVIIEVRAYNISYNRSSSYKAEVMNKFLSSKSLHLAVYSHVHDINS